MKKVRRFNGEDDSYVEGTASSKADDVSDQLRQDQTERMARLARGESGNAPAALTSRSIAPVAAEAPAAPAAPAAAAEAPAAKSEGFGSAFSKARAKALEGGPSTFVWAGDGKRYGTDLKKPAASTSPSSPPNVSNRGSGSGSGGGRGPTAEEFDDDQDDKASRKVQAEVDLYNLKLKAYKEAKEEAKSPEGKAKRAAMEKSQALEGSYPVENIAGGAAGLLKAGAGKLFGQGAAKEAAKRVEPTFREKELEIIKEVPRLLGGPKKQMALPAPPKQLALPAPPKRLPYDRPAASAAESTKAKLAGELRRGAQPTKFTSPSKSTTSKKTRKFNEDEGGVEFRRGGSVSSASKRADGCAIRGKTRA